MAPIKRHRPDTVTGDQLNENSYGHLSRDPRKKARISETHSYADNPSPRSNNSANEGPVDERQGDYDGDGDYERRRDAGFRDLVDEDLDTMRATQMIRQKNQRIMDNMPAENAIIESVTCINFMCHTKLHVALGPLINFIIGHNGSGKSAVLTAITLCLGGKATATNRGQSLKSFVKEGQDSSTLIVKLKNQGHTAYQQDVYGDSIVVERHFSIAGTSGFKLKSASGRVISTKKADLEEICDYFALQIDNPMNVLTQDMSRQFLNSSSPRDKYKFFVKGVQLEQLDLDYQLLTEIIDSIENKLQVKMDDISILENRADKAKRRLAMSDKQNSLRDRVRGLGRQMAWAQVEQQEQILETYNGELSKADGAIAEVEAAARAADEAFEAADQAFERATEAADIARESLVPIQEEEDRTKGELEKAKTDSGVLLASTTAPWLTCPNLIESFLQSEQRKIRDHLKIANASIVKVKHDIAEERRRLAEADGGIHNRRLAEIEQQEETVQEASGRYEEHTRRLSALEEAKKRAQIELGIGKGLLDQKRSEVQQSENQLRSLMRDRGQQQGTYHENMPRLLRAIQQDDGFRERPVGPIGNHVRLLKPLWSNILEKSFGATLNSFIVTSKQDQSSLSRLMQRINCSCPILIGNHHPIDTTNNEPDASFDTTLRVVEIDNDLVRKQLVINQGIDQTLLIENRSEAQSIMHDGGKLQNVKQCFSVNDRKPGWGIRWGYGRAGEPTSAPIPPFQGRPRMKTDIESQISIQRDTVERLKHDLGELEHRQRNLQGSVTECEQAITRYHRQHTSLQIEKQKAEEDLGKMREALEQDTVEDGHLDSLQINLQGAEEDKEICEGSYQNSVNEIDKSREKVKQIGEQLQAKRQAVAEAEFKAKKAQATASKASTQRQTALYEKNEAFQRIDDAKRDKCVIEKKQQAMLARVQDFTEKASRVSPRVTVDGGETPDSLEKKLEKLNHELDEYQRQIGGDPQEITEQATAAYIAFNTAKKQVGDLEELAQLLKSALIDRQDRWRKFRRYISARARSQFTYLLSERSFRGSLKTDHQRRILDLHVEPDETRDGKGRQTKTLSGGEKSFSTICLLLSLWEAMGSPIRCLDEFDVFMDNVNRDVSMRMMIGAARRSPGRQYILITPQSMGNVDVAADVKIIKLSDPERGQTTLPFAN